jgi:hypothetical protein
MHCKQTLASCTTLGCLTHWAGLHQYTTDPAAYQAALQRCQPVVLSVVTRDDTPSVETDCDGSYTCQCLTHTMERELREPVQIRQPWQPRQPKHLKAA